MRWRAGSANRSWHRGAARPGGMRQEGDRNSRPKGGQSLGVQRGAGRGAAKVGCDTVRILPSYILRLHLVPFLLGFGVVTFVFEMDVLFDYLDLVINRGVPPLAVLQLFALSLGFVVVLSVT